VEGPAIALVLLVVYIAAQVAVRNRPLTATGPLDVDEHLTYPAASQASSVFSLNALFGAYLGLFWLLGLPVLVGLALGSLGALAFLRSILRSSGKERFEDYLAELLNWERDGARLLLAGLVVLTQLAYVSSELLILRVVLANALALAPTHATIVTTAIALVAYFYVLRGGYVALFRADAVQSVFVVAMVAALLVSLRWSQLQSLASRLLPATLPYWEFPAVTPTARYGLHIVLGAVMGFSFLTASPDCWKRGFLVTRQPGRRPFLALVGASVLPFLVTIPLVLYSKPPARGPAMLLDAFPGLAANRVLLLVAVLGFIASALSALNGSLLLAAHMVLAGIKAHRETTLADFQWVFALCLLVFSSVFFLLVSLGNSYALGVLLIPSYAATAGLGFGTRGWRRLPATGVVLGLLILMQGAWLLYFCSDPARFATSSTEPVATIPVALMAFFIFALAGRLPAGKGSPA